MEKSGSGLEQQVNQLRVQGQSKWGTSNLHRAGKHAGRNFLAITRETST